MTDRTVDMDSRIDAWKKKLLDLGKRNRLLNYRDTKRGSIRLVAPDALALWKDFVEDENPVVFPYVNDEEVEDDAYRQPEVIEGNVKTNKSVPEQQKTLRSLRNKARSFINEQGVNALYLSFGFMRWTESANSSQVIQSPLILVPVTLQWESITSPFVLRLHDDEIVVNPTLAHKMENDFGLTMPDFGDGVSLESFFDTLGAQISSQGWSIEEGVSLSLLSFLKINMYNDLEDHRGSIASHPVVRALAGDVTGLTVDVSALDGFDHDANTTPAGSYLIVDADASQMDAIECAKKGASFVLQGPPGTGKSQTITNIVAECLADGKKVLFVSEKMAALDVVHRRLKDAGLDDFVLALHSHKANKKDVLAQLGRSLELSGNQVALRDEAYRSLDQLLDDREKLNDYSNQLHEVIEPLHKSIFDANGEIAEYCDVEDIVFPIADVRNTTVENYRAMNGALNRYRSLISSMQTPVDENPWLGTSLSFVGNELRHDLASKAAACEAGLRTLIETSDEAREHFGLSAGSLPELRELEPVLDVAGCSPGIPTSWLESGDFDSVDSCCAEQRNALEELRAIVRKIDAARAELGLTPVFSTEKDRFPNSELHARLERCMEDIKGKFASGPLLNSLRQLDYRDEIACIVADLSKHSECIRDLRNKSEMVFAPAVEQLDFESVKNRIDSFYNGAFLKKRELYLSDRAALSGVTPFLSDAMESDRKTLLALDKVCKVAELRSWESASPELAELGELDGRIADACEPEIDKIPYDEIFLRFKVSSASFVKVFNSQHKRDKAAVGALMKGLGGSKPSDSQVLSVLGMLRRRDELREWRDSSAEYRELRSLEGEVRALFEEGVFNID